MINALISTVLQAGVVLVVALIVYAVWGRKRSGFRDYVGLTGAPWRVVAITLGLGVVGAVAFLHLPGVREMAAGDKTVVGDATAGGVDATTLTILVLYAVFKTAFAEELLFRGLIGKRLIAWLGFQAGNLIQAVLFGAVHLLILLSPQATPLGVGMLVAFTGVMAWVSGWLNETKGRGSILPGWAMHAGANLTSYLGMALKLL